MTDHVEERDFTLRIETQARFGADYQGDDDGFAWVPELRVVLADVVQAAVRAVGAHPGWTVRTRNRGRSSDDEVILVLERNF